MNITQKTDISTKKLYDFRTTEMAAVQSGVFFKTPLALVTAESTLPKRTFLSLSASIGYIHTVEYMLMKSARGEGL